MSTCTFYPATTSQIKLAAEAILESTELFSDLPRQELAQMVKDIKKGACHIYHEFGSTKCLAVVHFKSESGSLESNVWYVQMDFFSENMRLGKAKVIADTQDLIGMPDLRITA